MGMYDNVREVQVKCFSIPYYTKAYRLRKPDISKEEILQSGISFSCGGLRYFKTNVPYKTAYYDYSPNFIIYDYDFTFEEINIIIIKNGKVRKIINSLDKLTDEDISGCNVISYYGDFLNLKSVEDFKRFKEDYLYYNKRLDIISRKSHKYLSEANKYNRIANGRSPLPEGLTIEEAKALVTKNLEKLDAEKKTTEKDIEHLRETCLYIYRVDHSEEFYKYETFGALLTCYDKLMTSSSKKLPSTASEYEKEFLEDSINDFHYLKSEIRDIVNDIDIEDFFLERQFSKKEEDYYRNIINLVVSEKIITED